MKRFKLIKEYPGSPKLGEIVKEVDTIKGRTPGFGIVPDKHVYDYPEYWREVIEDDWKILTFKEREGVRCWNLVNGVYKIKCNRVESSFMLSEMLEAMKTNKNLYIHTVKRLSDGEIFTIGDTVEHVDSNIDKGVIVKLKIVESYIPGYIGVDFIGSYKGESEYGFYNCLKVLKKSRVLLFTTEDGVDIYENDECWNCLVEPTEYNSFMLGKTNWSNKHPYNYAKYFSTKEKAEEYIELNIPKYSYNDIKNLVYELRLGNRGSDYADQRDAWKILLNKLKK